MSLEAALRRSCRPPAAYRHGCGAPHPAQSSCSDWGSAPRWFWQALPHRELQGFSRIHLMSSMAGSGTRMAAPDPQPCRQTARSADIHAYGAQASPSGSEAAAEALSSASAKAAVRSALALHESGAIDGNLVKNDGWQRKPDLGDRIRRRQDGSRDEGRDDGVLALARRALRWWPARHGRARSSPPAAGTPGRRRRSAS
jgi:hypothetical protein